MTQHNFEPSRTDVSRRDIDIAVGILVALRGYSEQRAFEELVAATYRTGGGISSVARSLITIAGGRSGPVPYHTEALRLWGRELVDR